MSREGRVGGVWVGMGRRGRDGTTRYRNATPGEYMMASGGKITLIVIEVSWKKKGRKIDGGNGVP